MRYFRDERLRAKEDQHTISNNIPKDEIYQSTYEIGRHSSSISAGFPSYRRMDSQSEFPSLFQRAMGPTSELDFLLLLAYE